MTKTDQIIHKVKARLGADCTMERDHDKQCIVLRYKGKSFTIHRYEYDSIVYVQTIVEYITQQLLNHVKQYEFTGLYANFGVSVARIADLNPCHDQLLRVIEEMGTQGYSIDHVFTDIKDFLKLVSVYDNTSWLINKKIIQQVKPKEMCPWDTSVELKETRTGMRWSDKEKDWLHAQFNELLPKEKLQEFLTSMAEKTRRSEKGIAAFIEVNCIR